MTVSLKSYEACSAIVESHRQTVIVHPLSVEISAGRFSSVGIVSVALFANEQRTYGSAVVKITAEEPREVMFKTFGSKWAIEYEDNPPKMENFPRGIHVLQ